MLRRFLICLAVALNLAATPAFAKEVLVLLPLNVDKSLQNEAQLFGTALQQGLSTGFDVFFGPAVEEKLQEEMSKEGCTAESCAQNLAISFNGELIADSTVQKLDSSYVVQIQINNIITGQIVKSLIEICDNCSKISLIQFVKNVGQKAAGGIGVSTPQIAVPTAPAAPQKRMISLRISTGSFDTQVYVNDRDLGRSPVTTPAYPEGERVNIRLATPGYKELNFAHLVGRNDQQLANISLVRNTRNLAIKSKPRRSDVFIDGRRIGTTPVETGDIEVGQRINIEVKKNGYETLRLSHIVGQNDTELSDLRLKRGLVKLYVDSQPRGANIYVDNRLAGQTPFEIGPYEDGERIRIRVEQEGYENFSRRHRVGRSDSKLAQIILKEQSAGGTSDKVRVPMGF